jgi:hypothetical protein
MSDDERGNSGSYSKQLTPLLKMNNYMDFKNVLHSHVVRYGVFVVSAITDFMDYPPVQHPGPNAPAHILQNHREDEKAHAQYKRDCAHTCSILYNSLSLDIKIRFDSNPDAYRAMSYGQLGLMWWHISEIVRETGQNSIMPMFTRIINHKTRNKQTWRQEVVLIVGLILSILEYFR